MDEQKLIEIGLNKNEAKIYLVLLKLGSSQAGKISKESQINRTTVYDTLNRLIEKGVVKYSLSANKKVFSATDPRKILKQLKDKQKSFESILPELTKLFSSSKQEESEIYRGRKGIKSILQDILNYKEYVAFGSSGKFMEIMKHDFELFQRQKKKLKINSRIILANSAKNTEQVKIAHSNFKFITDEYISPTTTFVYGENVAIVVWSENPIATLIKSKDVAKSYRNYFNLLWKQAKP